MDEGIWFSCEHNNRLVCGRLFRGGQISSILISSHFLITLAAQTSWKPHFYSMLDISHGICSTCTKALHFAFSQVIYICINKTQHLPFPILSSPPARSWRCDADGALVILRWPQRPEYREVAQIRHSPSPCSVPRAGQKGKRNSI